ncbi:unnamed protein product, partial [Didymodactylos carnosus]
RYPKTEQVICILPCGTSDHDIIKNIDKQYNGESPLPNGADRFIVKVQVPLDSGNDFLLVYNQSKSFQTTIHTDHLQYKQILDAIRTKGVRGLKGYFNASYKKETKKVQIDVQNI